MVGAYSNTYKWNRVTGERDPERMPVIITRCVNNFGPFQHPEKLIPLAICTLLEPEINGYKRRIPVYDKGLAVREWLHTEDHARAILHVLQHGQIGEIYNVGSGNRCRNRDLLLAIFRACAGHTSFSSLAEATFDATTSGGVAQHAPDMTSVTRPTVRSSRNLAGNLDTPGTFLRLKSEKSLTGIKQTAPGGSQCG